MDNKLDIKTERLTIDYDGKFVPKACCTIDRYGKADDCDGCQEICDNACRESSSLTDTCSNCPIQKCFNKLGEFENRVENGTLIDVPCKPGDTIYLVDSSRYVSYGIDELKVLEIHITETYGTTFLCSCEFAFNGCNVNLEHYDKWWFTDRSKAEQRIKELRLNE